jgi:hypothetical protein
MEGNVEAGKMKTEKGFETFKRLLVFCMGVAVLLTSIYFSTVGFEFKTDGTLWWVGLILALAVTSAQFMFNTRSKDLNWTIVLLGLVSYGYSIWSNIMGFYSLRGTESVWDWMNISGGVFMDVFPETAIAWSLGVIKAGDLVGNLVSVLNNPERVTAENTQTVKRYNEPRTEHFNKLPKKQTGRYDVPPLQDPRWVSRKAIVPDESAEMPDVQLDYPDFLRGKGGRR